MCHDLTFPLFKTDRFETRRDSELGDTRNQASGRSFMGYVICAGERVQVACPGPPRHAGGPGRLLNQQQSMQWHSSGPRRRAQS